MSWVDVDALVGVALRAGSLADALDRAERAAAEVGVTRVTAVTALDRIGVPVFVAMRPTAAPGGVCVTAGKGWTSMAARVGALMESVEQAWAEPGRARVETREIKVADLLDGRRRREAILDLCPRRGALIDLDASTLSVEATCVGSTDTTLVPAELVFHPAPPFLGAAYFGTGTNGLAAGVTVAEATLHGLIEVLERDAVSFHNLRDESLRLRITDLPPPFESLIEKLAEVRVALHVRCLPNVLGLPCFMAVIVDLDEPQLTVRGDGLHPDPMVALSRAITEALQCRLTIIHGGRDDLDHFVLRFTGHDRAARHAAAAALVRQLAEGPELGLEQVAGVAIAGDVEGALDALCARLATHGFPSVLRVVCTPADHPACVVRVIVPRLECFLAETRRIGPRLRGFARERG